MPPPPHPLAMLFPRRFARAIEQAQAKVVAGTDNKVVLFPNHGEPSCPGVGVGRRDLWVHPVTVDRDGTGPTEWPEGGFQALVPGPGGCGTASRC